jgi:hypothetical protein
MTLREYIEVLKSQSKELQDKLLVDHDSGKAVLGLSVLIGPEPGYTVSIKVSTDTMGG